MSRDIDISSMKFCNPFRYILIIYILYTFAIFNRVDRNFCLINNISIYVL